MDGFKFFGWGVVSASGDSHSSLTYKDKEEAVEHCFRWNQVKGLENNRPYRPVELFVKEE